MHVRAQLRRVIADMMRSTSVGENVFPSRLFSLDDEQLPSISVYTTDESNLEAVTKVTLGRPPIINRTMPLVIEAHAKIDDGIDDTLDALAAEIERAMASEIYVEERMIPAQLVSTQTFFSGDSDQEVGVIRLIYSVAYSTREDAPESLA